MTVTTSDYLADAAAAADVLTSKWFGAWTPGDWVPEDFWKTPTIAGELATYMSLAGTQDHFDVVEAARVAGVDSGYLTSSLYLDDATCWGRLGITVQAWLAAIGSAHAGDYLDLATTVCDDLQQQWNDVCGGGLYWMRDPSQGDDPKATNSTLGMMETALGLNAATHDRSRLAWGLRAWAWITAKQLVDGTGLVWGGLTQPPGCAIDPQNRPVIALQGNPLRPLWLLYVQERDEALLDTCELILAGTFRTFTWPGSSIFTNAIDGEWARQTEKWRVDKINDTMFKGIFAGFLGEFVVRLATVPGREAAAVRYAEVLRANAEALRTNFPTGVYGMDWHTPAPTYRGDRSEMLNACLQFSALAAFDGAAAVAEIS